MPVIAGRNVNNNDLGVMAGGAVVLVFSFFHWFSYGLNIIGVPADISVNGWNSGFFAWLGVLLSIAAAVLVAVRVFANVQLPRLQWGWGFIIFAAAALGALLILLKLLIGYHSGSRGLGLYLSLIGALVETGFAYLAFKVSGETLPGGRRL
ncbi:MAG TPA: hypothetical protein VLR26_08340 [Frankiaceae bacterium]|nr:hypothetical protein [Frankiaceae bacterium]